MILETMMKRNILLYVNSMNKTVQIPFIFSKTVDKLIGRVAINHLINEFNQIIYIKNDEICCCNNIIKLPCRHSLLKNLNKIDVPIEYLRIKCNSLYETNYVTMCSDKIKC